MSKRYYKVELVIGSESWSQQHLIDMCWRVFAGRSHAGTDLVRNIVYEVSADDWKDA